MREEAKTFKAKISVLEQNLDALLKQKAEAIKIIKQLETEKEQQHDKSKETSVAIKKSYDDEIAATLQLIDVTTDEDDKAKLQKRIHEIEHRRDSRLVEAEKENIASRAELEKRLEEQKKALRDAEEQERKEKFALEEQKRAAKMEAEKHAAETETDQHIKKLKLKLADAKVNRDFLQALELTKRIEAWPKIYTEFLAVVSTKEAEIATNEKMISAAIMAKEFEKCEDLDLERRKLDASLEQIKSQLTVDQAVFDRKLEQLATESLNKGRDSFVVAAELEGLQKELQADLDREMAAKTWAKCKVLRDDLVYVDAFSKWTAEKSDELASAEASGDMLECARLVNELTAYPRTVEAARAKAIAEKAACDKAAADKARTGVSHLNT